MIESPSATITSISSTLTSAARTNTQQRNTLLKIRITNKEKWTFTDVRVHSVFLRGKRAHIICQQNTKQKKHICSTPKTYLNLPYWLKYTSRISFIHSFHWSGTKTMSVFKKSTSVYVFWANYSFQDRMADQSLTSHESECVTGGHRTYMYNFIWAPGSGELVLQPDNVNQPDEHALDGIMDSYTVGHTPHLISKFFEFFLKCGGYVNTLVTRKQALGNGLTSLTRHLCERWHLLAATPNSHTKY